MKLEKYTKSVKKMKKWKENKVLKTSIKNMNMEK